MNLFLCANTEATTKKWSLRIQFWQTRTIQLTISNGFVSMAVNDCRKSEIALPNLSPSARTLNLSVLTVTLLLLIVPLRWKGTIWMPLSFICNERSGCESKVVNKKRLQMNSCLVSELVEQRCSYLDNRSDIGGGHAS